MTRYAYWKLIIVGFYFGILSVIFVYNISSSAIKPGRPRAGPPQLLHFLSGFTPMSPQQNNSQLGLKVLIIQIMKFLLT